MPTFRYRYVDESSTEPLKTGRVGAASREEALLQLASEGLDPSRLVLEEVMLEGEISSEETPLNESKPTAESTGRPLNDAEAQTVAVELASLAQSGLPLPGGLRALAEELGIGSTSNILCDLADRIDGGQSIETALKSLGDRLPAHLRGLIVTGVTSGRLNELLEEYVDLRRDQAELRHRMWLAIAYPLVLVGFLAFLIAGLSFYVIPQFADIFDDFCAPMPIMTKLVIAFAHTGIWYFLGIVAVISVVIGLSLSRHMPLWIKTCVYHIPIFGPFWRWGRLMPLARLLALLVEKGVPLPAALRATADGLKDRHLAAGCRSAAMEVEAGGSLGDSLAASGVFPRSTIPLMDWATRFGSLPVALRFIAESFEGRVRLQTEMAKIVALPTALVIVVIVGFCVISLFLPMIGIVEHLC